MQVTGHLPPRSVLILAQVTDPSGTTGNSSLWHWVSSSGKYEVKHAWLWKLPPCYWTKNPDQLLTSKRANIDYSLKIKLPLTAGSSLLPHSVCASGKCVSCTGEVTIVTPGIKTNICLCRPRDDCMFLYTKEFLDDSKYLPDVTLGSCFHWISKRPWTYHVSIWWWKAWYFASCIHF